MNTFTIVLPASRRWQAFAIVASIVTLAIGCYSDAISAPRQLDNARGLAADLRVEFNKAAHASDRAVMADTDEASLEFAHEAEKSVQAVETDVAALAPVLHSLRFADEIQLLQQFGKPFAEYRNLDHNILTLAVENTNLKAQRLSFGPARQAVDRFRNALGAVVSAVPAVDRCRVEGLVAKAVLAVTAIQVLHAPHIAEADDASMTEMESKMAESDASASDAMKALEQFARPSTRPALDTALSALAEFRVISGQIVALSRRNSNVRSLELSLRTKPALVAACDEKLRALQDALAKEGFKATR